MVEMPDLWWSPTEGLIEREDGLLWLLTKGPLLEDGDAPLPADAAQLGKGLGVAEMPDNQALAKVREIAQWWNDEPGAIADERIADKAMRRIRAVLRASVRGETP